MALLDDYESVVYTLNPIISKTEVVDAIHRMDSHRESCALVHAVAAMTINMTCTNCADNEDMRGKVVSLCTKALETRGPPLPHDIITVESIMISAFVACCLFAHKNHVDMGFFYVREAVTCLQIMGIDSPEATSDLSIKARSQRQRLYWLLFVHERFGSVFFFRTPILPPLASTPERDPDLSSEMQDWFDSIITRFAMIDQTFISNWLSKDDQTTSSSTDLSWITSTQHQLSQAMSLFDYQYQTLSETQQVDVIITSYWLGTLVWQIALSKLLLTTNPTTDTDALSMFFPLRLSGRLQSLLTSISRSAVEIHGTGILQKIFDITTTIADILIYVSDAANADDSGVYWSRSGLNDFAFLNSYLMNMPTFYTMERKILTEKYEKVRVLFPHICAGPASARRSPAL